MLVLMRRDATGWEVGIDNGLFIWAGQGPTVTMALVEAIAAVLDDKWMAEDGVRS